MKLPIWKLQFTLYIFSKIYFLSGNDIPTYFVYFLSWSKEKIFLKLVVQRNLSPFYHAPDKLSIPLNQLLCNQIYKPLYNHNLITHYLLLPIIYYWLLFIKKNKKNEKKEKPGCKKIKALDHCFGKSLRQFLCEARSILRFPVQVTHFRFNHIRFNHFRLITSGSGKTPQYQHTISLFFSF